MNTIKIGIKSLIIVLIFTLSSCKTMHSPKYSGTTSPTLWFPEDEYKIDSNQSLTKKNGEDFRILLLADIQIDGALGRTRKTLKLIDRLIDSVKPDYILTLGDNSEGYYSDNMAKKLIKFLDKKDIPWSVTLGNHDSEHRKARAWYGNRYEEGKNSIFKYGPSNIHGVGNYAVNLKDENGDVIYSLIMMDSNDYRQYDDGSGYDFIHRDQINWYKWQIDGVNKSQYGNSNTKVPNMSFFHIPLLEFGDAAKAVKEGTIESKYVVGINKEGVAGAKVNSGLFTVMKDMESTTHVFCGHDHINNMSVKWQGIRLSYGLKTGPTSYYDDEMQGGTLVTVSAGNDNKNSSSAKVDIEYIYIND